MSHDGDRTARRFSNAVELDWGSDVIAQMLRSLELPYICVTPGASYRGLHDSIVNYLGNAIRRCCFACTKSIAVAIAHGYAKVTDKPLAVALHSNVGLMHATMAIFNAWCDRVPVLMLGATGPVDATQRRPWIDWIHTPATRRAIVRALHQVGRSAGLVPAALESMLRAKQIARRAPLGPSTSLSTPASRRRAREPLPLPDLARFRRRCRRSPARRTVTRAAALLAGEAPADPDRPRVAERGGLERARRACRAPRRDRAHRLQNRGASFPTDHPLHGAPPSLLVRPERWSACARPM